MLSSQQHVITYEHQISRAFQRNWHYCTRRTGPKAVRSSHGSGSYRACFEQFFRTLGGADKVPAGDGSGRQLTGSEPIYMVHVHTPLPVTRVALGNDGQYVVESRVDEKSKPESLALTEIQWSEHLPSSLQAALTEVQSKLVRGSSDVSLFALGKSQGNSDHWLVEFKDYYYGNPSCPEITTWAGSDTSFVMSKVAADKGLKLSALDELDQIEELHFAPNGWYFETKDEVVVWQGLPESLDAVLTKYVKAYGGVRRLSVGHGGEWFVKYWNGAFQWEGVHPVLEQMLRKPGRSIGEPIWVELGPEKTFVAQFDECTVWYAQEDLTAVLLSTVHGESEEADSAGGD